MPILLKIASWLRARAENICAILLASMFASFLVQIVFRYGLNLPLGWTVEYVTVAWLWGILFGFAFVVRDEDIIRLDILYNAVPARVQRAMDILANTIAAVILVWSLPKAIGYVDFMKVEKTAFMHIRFDYLFSIYIPFVVMVVLRALLTVVRAIRGIRHADPISSAGRDEYV